MSKRPVYLDHAATTPVRPEVLEAMLPYLGSTSFGNPSSAHRFGRAARAGLEQARREGLPRGGAGRGHRAHAGGGAAAPPRRPANAGGRFGDRAQGRAGGGPPG